MKYNINRRDFVRAVAGVTGVGLVGLSLIKKKHEPLLSFSTLGTPDWPFSKIVEFARTNNYQGIELRGILRQLDLGKCPEFSSADNIKATRRIVEQNGLKIVGLGSSSYLHLPAGAERVKHLDDAKRFIDLAKQLNCPYVRVFPNNLPKDEDKERVLERIAAGLTELGNYSKGSNVMVLMETHGEVVLSADIKKVMEISQPAGVGLVWDIFNMWSVTKESPKVVYQLLKPYIRHTHIKDARIVNGKDQYTLLGQGETPIFEAIDLLASDNYRGYYSFEWEKLWHPEIAEPEIAIAAYSKTMQEYFRKR